MNKLKIAFLLLSGGIVNRGAEHSMLMLAENLAKLGHQVTVFQAGDVSFGTSFTTVKIKLPVSPTSHKPTSLIGKVFERFYLNHRGLLTLLFSLKTAHSLKAFDIIIPTDGFWQVLVAKITKNKSAKIVTVGLAGGWTDRDSLKLGPDAFVALSTKAQQTAQSLNPKVVTQIIPLQVDVDMFQKASPIPLHLQRPVILTIAALTKYKQVDKVIEAAASIQGASLLIVGQGEEQKNLQQLAERLLPGRYEIRTAGFEEIPAIYKSADVFVLASQPQEAFGQVLVEAMAAGLPIVTTDDVVRREIVGQQGVYVDPDNQAGFTEAIKNAITHHQVDYEVDKYRREAIAVRYNQLFATLTGKV